MIARHLAIRNVAVRVVILTPADEFTGDAQTNFQIIERLGLRIADLSRADDLSAKLAEVSHGVDWLVDALLGTGAVGEPREPYRAAITWLNRQPHPTLAVDLPSGLDCDTGAPSATTVRADVTCTFHTPKVGFAAREAQEFLGELHVVSIGLPVEGWGAA